MMGAGLIPNQMNPYLEKYLGTTVTLANSH